MIYKYSSFCFILENHFNNKVLPYNYNDYNFLKIFIVKLYFNFIKNFVFNSKTVKSLKPPEKLKGWKQKRS